MARSSHPQRSGMRPRHEAELQVKSQRVGELPNLLEDQIFLSQLDGETSML